MIFQFQQRFCHLPRTVDAFDRLLLARAVQPLSVFQMELKRYALEVLAEGDQPEGYPTEAQHGAAMASLIS